MGLVVLVGGDEFRPPCFDMDRWLLARTGRSRPRVVVVPTAAARSNPQLSARNGIEYFGSLGADASAAMILDFADANDEVLVNEVRQADLVYLAGGDPWHLLECLTNTRLLTAILEVLAGGQVVAGSSAGAMVLGQFMRAREPDRWVSATGVVAKVAVSVHHERWQTISVAALRSGLDEDVSLIGVETSTAAVRTSAGQWEVIGAGVVAVYRGDEVHRFQAGQGFTLE